MSHDEYKTLLSDKLCKGAKSYPDYEDRNGAEIAKACFELAGKQDAANAVLPVLPGDTPQTYIQRMSVEWDALPFDESFVLQDCDWLVFAWNMDGTASMNTSRIFSKDGNVTTGFLIKASEDFPIAWLSHDSSILSGVFPLAECLEKRYFSENQRGRIAIVFRYRERA